VTDMATEITPIYDTVISELGNPISATPIDCSYAAMVKMATGGEKAEKAEKAENAPAVPITLPSPAAGKRPVKSAPAKPFAVVAGDKAS
jgi:hypothetical protein